MTEAKGNLKRKMGSINRDRFIFFTAVVFCTCAGTFLWADFLWRTDLYGLKWALLFLFVPLFWQISFGFCQSFVGFCLSRGRRGPDSDVSGDTNCFEDSTTLTALLFPVYNEDPARVFAGLVATAKGLRARGILDRFEFFVLSDTRDASVWIEEERAWLHACGAYGLQGRLHYRRREHNSEKKAGNIADFIQRWGRGYDYMIVFDADSLISAETIRKMVARMDVNPRMGILQTAPGLCRGVTFFGRLQQFANRMYGSIFTRGLDFWQQRSGNYWGHNAIIRIAPFAAACDLPDLPWREPIGGKIMSHDFVEAALMRRAGFEVCLAEDIGESYEEGPPHLLAFAQRDRRWCQGNFQHAWLALAKGIPDLNRLHFVNGIMAYLGGFLWLVSLVLATLVVINFDRSGLSLIVVPSNTPFTRLSLQEHALILTGFTATLLFLPKVLGWLDVAMRGELRRYGGFLRSLVSVVVEIFLSALLAPVMMLYHTQFCLSVMFGLRVDWVAQDRGGQDRLPWATAWRAHLKHLLIGMVWGIIAYYFDTNFFWWMSPVLLGLLLAAPLTVLLSSETVGRWLRGRGILRIPEEIHPPSVVAEIPDLEAEFSKVINSTPTSGVVAAIVDPYVNALHSALQRDRHSDDGNDCCRHIIDTAMKRGIDALKAEEREALLLSPQAMRKFHYEIWHRSDQARHPEWNEAIHSYALRI